MTRSLKSEMVKMVKICTVFSRPSSPENYFPMAKVRRKVCLSSPSSPFKIENVMISIEGSGESVTPPSAGSAPTTIAKEWLLRENEEWFGPRPKWTSSQIEAHQKDLGLLCQFVTDCWPND